MVWVLAVRSKATIGRLHKTRSLVRETRSGIPDYPVPIPKSNLRLNPNRTKHHKWQPSGF